jgi:hypothetical protein
VESIGCGRVDLHERWECSLALGGWLGVQEVDDKVAVFDANHGRGKGGGATWTGVMVGVARASRLE